VKPDGSVRWALARHGPVRMARWNGPDGYRIAYLDGRSLRVVHGNGEEDRLLARNVPRAAPAWKSGPAHVLAFEATVSGAVKAVAADTGAQLFETPGGAGVESLQLASGDLLVTRPDGLQLYDANGRIVWRWAAPRGTLVWSATASHQGRRIAMVLHQDRISKLLLLGPGRSPRVLFAGPGHFAAPLWSPAGGWLLLPWPSADQLLFLGPGTGAPRPDAVANVASQFAPGLRRAARFPAIAGWCCSR
jgi:hypothetical protein